jgi:hypothetical protein
LRLNPPLAAHRDRKSLPRRRLPPSDVTVERLAAAFRNLGDERFIGLPIAIGVMAAALLLSLALIGLDAAGIDFGLR